METQLSTIIKIAIVMDEAEAREFLVSPAPLQDEVRRQLALGHGGNGHSRNGKVAPLPKVARGRRAGGRMAQATTSEPKEWPCPQCKRIFKSSGRRATHVTKVHQGKLEKTAASAATS